MESGSFLRRRSVAPRWMGFQASLALAILAAALAMIEWLAARNGGPRPSRELLTSMFTSVTAATIYFRYLLHERGRRSTGRVVYRGFLLLGLVPLWWTANAGTPASLFAALVGLGALGVVGFLATAILERDAMRRQATLLQLAPALVLPVGASLIHFGQWSMAQLNPVYDAQVYAFEQILGFQFSIAGVRSFHVLHPLSFIAAVCYAALGLGVVLVAAKQRRFRLEVEVLAAALLLGIVGWALYHVCPVVGPLIAFGPPYPDALPALSPGNVPLLTAPIGPPRNGMPSLHTAWALLIWFNARTLDTRWRWSLNAFVILTLWAVMGLDNTHWLMDVVVAVPLAVAVQLSCISGRRRWASTIGCGMLTAGWLVGFREWTLLLQLPRSVA